MSKNRSLPVVFVVLALLGGCAATVQRSQIPESAPSMNIPAESARRVVLNMQLDPRHPQDSGWNDFKQEWIDITKQQSLAQGYEFAAQDGAPQPTGQAGTLMVVRIDDYRHVGVAARVMLGIMTGNAFIDAKVEFRDLQSGKLYGERSYNTSSSAMQGVFAPVTPKQIYALADEALAEIKRR